MERAAEEKRKQARKIEQKAKGASKKKSTEGGGRLAHQKSIGSKEKKMHNAAKSLEHRTVYEMRHASDEPVDE